MSKEVYFHLTNGCGSKLNRRGYAGFGPCFHLPGFHFGYRLFQPQPNAKDTDPRVLPSVYSSGMSCRASESFFPNLRQLEWCKPTMGSGLIACHPPSTRPNYAPNTYPPPTNWNCTNSSGKTAFLLKTTFLLKTGSANLHVWRVWWGRARPGRDSEKTNLARRPVLVNPCLFIGRWGPLQKWSDSPHFTRGHPPY